MASVRVMFALLVLILVPSPASAERCFPECYRTGECWPVGPGRMRCKQRCRWNCPQAPRYVAPPPPRYYPPPEPRYQPPPYIAPTHQAAPRMDDGLLLLGGAVVFIILIIGLAASLKPSPHDTLRTDADIRKTNELTSALEAAARDADRHIAAAIAKARHGGRHG